mgnify:CR=1 FL=1
MILSKLIVNQVATYLTNHFKLDKVMSYVFNDNELDTKVKCLEGKVKLLEKLSHAPREFVICNKCKKQIK